MTDYLMTVAEFAVPCLIMWGVLLVSMLIDRSRYRNCVFLLAAILSTMPLICSMAGSHYAGAVFAMTLVIMILLLFLPGILIANGIVMMRREGRSLANLLSLFLGMAIGIGVLSYFCLHLLPNLWSQEYASLVVRGIRISLLVSATIAYGSLSFAGFLLYTLLLQIIPRKRDFDYVIIHGSGLLQGRRVGKLLADRIDKAIEVYQKDPSTPYLIPSGGQGEDEEISEAEAMRQYLVEKGIPSDHILPEDRSTTTRENIVYSKAIIEAREGRRYTALVTSNYHVYRALRYARDMDFACTGIGAHVAMYYWPSALIREYAAIHSERINFIVLAAGWLLTMALVSYIGVGSFLQ